MSDDAEAELDRLIQSSAEEGVDIGDDEVEIDLSEATTYEPFTDKVPVEIVAVELKNGPKARYIEARLRVFEGEHEGRALWTNLTLSGKGASFGFEYLNAFGATSADEVPISRENTRISLKRLIGLRGVAACAPDAREEYKNKVVVGKITAYVSAATEASADLK